VLCILDVGWEELSYYLLEPVIDVLGADLWDDVDRADNQSWLHVFLMDFVDSINLRCMSLTEVVF
jgi:hypothetical protein